MIRDADTGHRILLIEVPEPKSVKNRGQHGPGTGWVVFADPEGNEICILRSEGEAAGGPPTED